MLSLEKLPKSSIEVIQICLSWRLKTIIKIYRKLALNKQVKLIFFSFYNRLPKNKYLSTQKQIDNYKQEIFSEIGEYIK